MKAQSYRPPASVDTSEWAFIRDFCACAVSTESSCAGIYKLRVLTCRICCYFVVLVCSMLL